MRSTCKCGGLDGVHLQIRGHGLEPWARQGLQGPGCFRGPSTLDLWGLWTGPSLLWARLPTHQPEQRPFPLLGPVRTVGESPCQLCCAVPARLFGTAARGQWPMEAALPGICDVQGGEVAARALAASPKTLNFPDFHYNQGGTEKRAGWQMWLLPGCSARRCGARGVWAARGPPLSGPLIFIDSCTLCSSCRPNPELFIPGTQSGEAKGSLEPQTLPIGWCAEWGTSRSRRESEPEQSARRSHPLTEALGHRVWPTIAAV